VLGNVLTLLLIITDVKLKLVFLNCAHFEELSDEAGKEAATTEMDPSTNSFGKVDVIFPVNGPGLQDFSCYMIPKPEKMYQMNAKLTKWAYK
jgi:hypothetical protein